MRNWRANFTLIFFILLGATIIGRLVYIQILRYDYYRALAQGQQKIFQEISGDRGEIFLKDKDSLKPIAVNKTWYFCYADPNEIKNKEETAKILSQILTLNEMVVLEKLKKEDSFFGILKKRLNEEEISALKKSNLTGIYLNEEMGRYYPLESLAAQLVGFLGGDGVGQYGLEGYFHEILKGEDQFEEKERGPLGYLMNLTEAKAKKGTNLILTVDYNIQFMAEKLLKKAKEDLDIEAGTILVLDPNLGKIIAMANLPSFNPNEYQKEENLTVFQNQAIQKTFEPGSIFKPITMAAALNEGKITPQTTYKDEGFVKIGGHIITNYQNKSWGQRTMTEVLEKSINSGAIFAEQQIGNKLFLDYIEKFGFFEPTGIDLQGEVFSKNTNFKNGYEVNFATASFGQGIEVTPIQLVRAISIIANGGKLVKPYIVEKIIEDYNPPTTSSHSDLSEWTPNKIIETQTEIQNNSVISPKIANQLTAMMVSVVENGFGKTVKIPGYYIAGKTGTAQVTWSALGIEKPGYSSMTIQSFVGFFPAFNPQFLILVKLDNTKTPSAGYSAAPIFKELAEYIINYKEIPPDYEL